MNLLKGKVHKYKDNIDTDVIIPARYLNTSDPKELAKHCLEDLDKDFVRKVRPGDIIVAGENFGCGSSREHAPVAIKACGVACVLAKSFARIFYRNAFNIGLPIIESKEAAEEIEEGNIIEIDLTQGTITNTSKNKAYKIFPFPEFMQRLIQEEGLINYIKATR